METACNARAIGIEHKEVIEKIRNDCGHKQSSHAFVSLYLWQEEMKLSLLADEDFFAVKCGNAEENTWFFPCGNEEKVYDFIAEKSEEKSFSLCYIRDCDKDWLEKRFPDMWVFKRAEESDEYICDIAEYTALEGSKFSEIRRKIRKIDKEYSITVREITDETKTDAMRVAQKWYGQEHQSGNKGLTDNLIAEKAINEREKLGIEGIILYADNIPVSVFAGFPLCDDTVDVLIGKCTPDAPKGTAYYALREYLRLAESRYTYCNHEEDLGIEGIRQMKTSLCPCFKAEMWEASLK